MTMKLSLSFLTILRIPAAHTLIFANKKPSIRSCTFPNLRNFGTRFCLCFKKIRSFFCCYAIELLNLNLHFKTVTLAISNIKLPNLEV